MIDREPWDRRPNEPRTAYEAFRRYRALSLPTRQLEDLVTDEVPLTRLQQWRSHWGWVERCDAWDAACHRIEDQERLEALRAMHHRHVEAGQQVVKLALAALTAVDPKDVPPYVAARLLAIGASLERETLVVSVEELQGVDPEPADDPWERIARELEVSTEVGSFGA